LNIVDIHNHLLPGVDDGARTSDESLFHLRAFHREGVVRTAVSPHLFGWLSEKNQLDAHLDRLEASFDELRSYVADRADVPRLHFSQEILCPTPAVARAVFRTGRPGVRDTDYALVEFGFDLKGDCRDVVRAVSDCGKRMIVSHPERFRRDGHRVTVEEIHSWKRAGAALQVNGGSLLGDHGSSVQETAWRLLHEGVADMVASDHHADHRPLSLKDVYTEIVRRGGEEQAHLLMSENTGRVLDGLDLLAVPGWGAE
jgi:protein-tyrosine phosphatase